MDKSVPLTCESCEGAEVEFHFRGGNAALDFANTLSLDCCDRLVDAHQLISWASQAGLLSAQDQQRLAAEVARDPERASRAYRGAVALRDALFRLFSDVAEERKPAAEDLGLLNSWLPKALSRLTVSGAGGGYTLGFGPIESLDEVLHPVVRAAADLLASEASLARLRGCCRDDCGWLFLDTTKNRSRRWCGMADCGNRAKAQRHYQRVKGR